MLLTVSKIYEDDRALAPMTIERGRIGTYLDTFEVGFSGTKVSLDGRQVIV